MHGALLVLKQQKAKQVHLRVASSFISFEQAELNLKREQGNDDFDTPEQKAKDSLEQNFEPY